MCKNKKIVLYAPTFRGNGKKTAHTDTHVLNLDYLASKLNDDYIVLVKAHPFSKNDFKFTSNKIIDISSTTDINKILPSVDILITDYSSVIFDALLLKINTILYVKDKDKYLKNRGLYYNIEDYNFGSIVKNEDELIRAIKNPIFNKEKASIIKEKHLNMCDGYSTKRFVETYLK
jgi:CDP-ribitol ribitolphosphotransferase